MVGSLGGGGDFGDRLLMSRALLSGDYGAAAAMRASQAHRAGAAAAAERERDAEGRRMEALGNLRFSKDEISAMTPAEASREVASRARARLEAVGVAPPAPAFDVGNGFAPPPRDDPPPGIEAELYAPSARGRITWGSRNPYR